ncbi:mucin-5AC [Anopheles arabiensis]|uniref:mucin-5AC n=1 Tax=Anopheles arabiensis TaxID=7173 RepID=UPI001AAD3A38|nr:mucin-5AC [Anopheles arabiensis]XP_040152611.1 mucin-5AC [Anopheles arabiensis]XP_040152612.1 mucin-5AC [Anopheles arabiensis]XP_040152613.1 mucin-5AC [Anopheles arabiensis]XP_040152614.1 mucin-5AC [Anopheles arabiensis]XP_040152615.1 mucin-5AC [Anopheles arabiensis]XP_040152616.1 mucin-5AC [Anopheles arabiensis]
MAKVSHLPMRRYPTDQPAAVNVDPINFYPPANAAHHRVPKPTDKGKKTWGQRLKLSKASPVAEDKQSAGPANGTASSNGSALIPFGARSYDPSLDYSGNGPASLSSVGHSNSSHTNVHQLATMKYAETWVYGTVRGMPPPLAMSPHHPHHPHLPAMYCPPPPPPEVAVLICCCPEYLTGTKREIKKASVCKKCKGSRLPLAPIGGTMRLTSGATYLAPPPIRTSAGTVKLASTYAKKSRPTILGNGNPDPYDFMRRSRLTQPAESGAGGPKSVKSSLKEKLRGRAKSTSPSRGRSGSTAGGKRSSAARSPSPSLSKNGSRVGGRKLESFQDCWVGEPDRDTDLLDDGPTSTAQNRKSILRCDVNPYDLISLSGIGGSSGGGSGGNNMLNEFAPDGDEFDLHSQKYENILDTLYANRYNPNPANSIAAINGQRIKLFDDSGTSVSGAPVYDDVDEFVYDPVEVPVEEAQATDEPSSPSAGTPERPPRSKQRQLEATKENDDSRSLPSTAPSGTAEAGSPGVTQSAIKSILKRPSSMPAGPPSSMVTVEKDTGAGGPGYDTIRLNHTLVQRLAKLTTNGNGSASEEGASTFGKHGTISARHLTDKRNSGSQFYLPTPFPVIASSSEPEATQSTTGGRKKVHFLVENEIIHDDDRLFAQMLFTEVVPGEVTPVPVKTTNGATERGAAAEESIGSRKDKPASSKQVETEELAKVILLPAATITNAPTLANGTNEERTKPSAVATVFQRRAGPVRRSFSDRSSPTAKTNGYGGHPANGTTARDDQFNDTMALRVRPLRTDSRTAFDDETASLTTSSSSSSESSIGSISSLLLAVGQGGKARPKLPPPPPPPPPTTTQLPTGANWKAPASATPPPPGSNVYEDFCFGLMAGVRRSSSDRSSSTSTSSRTVVQVLASSSSFSSSSFTPSSPSSCGSSPSPIASSGGIHRLEIRHDPEPEEEHYQKKTSILITGDDCYSTVNVDGASDTPIYQSSVVVNDGSVVASPTNEIRQTASNTITISVSSPTSTLESRGSKGRMETGKLAGDEQHANGTVVTMGREEVTTVSTGTSVIPIGGSSVTGSNGRTLINLDFGQAEQSVDSSNTASQTDTTSEDVTPIAPVPSDSNDSKDSPKVREDAAHDQQQQQIVVKQTSVDLTPTPVVLRRSLKPTTEPTSTVNSLQAKVCRNSFIAKLLEDPSLSQLSEGLDYELIAKLIESSLLRLKESRNGLDMSGTKDEDDVSKMIEQSLLKIQEERSKLTAPSNPTSQSPQQNSGSKRSSVSSGNSYGSAAAYELMEFDQLGELSDCYQSCSSDLTVDDDAHSSRSKFYQMLVDATLSELEINTANEDDDDEHHYESIRLNGDPIYEEINDIPPPLPLTAPPIDDVDLEKQRNARSIFEGASKYDILSYLVDAKERGIVQEDGSYGFQFGGAGDIILEEEESEPITELRHHQRQISDISSRLSHLSGISDSSEDTSLSAGTLSNGRSSKASAEIERNDSGVGSETSKTSRSRWQNPISTTTTSTTTSSLLTKITPIHLCEDCDGPVETQVTESGVMYAPLVCRKCGKKRAERKEIITEIVETEEKYGRDLQIILEEFYQPMLVAGLLNQEQLSAIFLNVEELLENNQFLAERMRDALDIANEQGDDDLLTVSIGKIFLEAAPMLHAFESYCVRQGAASLLLANLEKEKELLRIFLRVSQMENAVLRRMNLNSFLMVPVQRVTKYPLLLARLYKVTPAHLEGKELLKQSQEKIELHLNHMNREAKDVPTKLWRRISSSSPGRRLSCELDMINIKLRKMAVDVLEWNHEEVRFAIEGRLLFTQPNDGNWKKSRTIKLTSINALLVTNGKPTASYKADRALSETLSFPRHTGIREASLLLVREKGGRYTLLREPLFLDRCIVCSEHDWEDYFEVQEILSKESFIFKAEDGTKTKQWYAQLQYHSQGMGTWRKRRNALANIMINGMMTRT